MQLHYLCQNLSVISLENDATLLSAVCPDDTCVFFPCITIMSHLFQFSDVTVDVDEIDEKQV